IDLGPDIMSASQMHGCSLDEVRYCLQTHPHADHLDLSHLLSRSPAYGVVGAPVLDFYASARPWNEPQKRLKETLRITVSCLLKRRGISTSRSARSSRWNLSQWAH